MPNNMIFSNPEFLWLIIVLLFLILIDYKFKSQKISNFNISSIKSFSKKSLKARLYPFLNIIRYLHELVYELFGVDYTNYDELQDILKLTFY